MTLQVWAWGWNERGTLGLGHRDLELRPKRVSALRGIRIRQASPPAVPTPTWPHDRMMGTPTHPHDIQNACGDPSIHESQPVTFSHAPPNVPPPSGRCQWLALPRPVGRGPGVRLGGERVPAVRRPRRPAGSPAALTVCPPPQGMYVCVYVYVCVCVCAWLSLSVR